MNLILPPQINGQALLPFIADLGKADADEEDIHLDFRNLRRVTPAGLVALTACITRWRSDHRRVFLDGLSECTIRGYLQRMDLLKCAGVEVTESFVRHDSKGRFVPVRLIDHQVEDMGFEIAECLAPGGDAFDHPLCGLYDFAWYVLTETANNVRQHSRGLGYASAQVTRQDGMVKIAIADGGRGIRQSFLDAGLPWSSEMSDAEAILKALQPRISSKGRPTNEGVGLTLVGRLTELTEAWLLVVSGTGAVTLSGGGEPVVSNLPNGGFYRGTIIGLSFRQDRVGDFAKLLHDAKVNAGLLPGTGGSGKFVK